MSRKSAQKGSVILVPVIIVGVIILIVGIMIVTGFEFSGSFNVGETSRTQENASQNQVGEEETQEPENQASAPQASLSETYTNENPAFSINYPQGWTTNQAGNTITIYTREGDAQNEAESMAAAIVTSTPLGALSDSLFSTLVDLNKTQLKQQFPTAQFGEEKDLQINGQQSHYYDFLYDDSGTLFKARFYILANEGTLYGLLIAVKEKDWPKYQNTLEGITGSFKIL